MSKLALPRLHTCCEVISLTPYGGSIAFEIHDTVYSVGEQNDSSHSFVLSWSVRLCLAIRPESVTCGGFYNSDLLCTHFWLAEVWYSKQEVRAVERAFPVESMTDVVQTTLGILAPDDGLRALFRSVPYQNVLRSSTRNLSSGSAIIPREHKGIHIHS